MGYRYNVFSGEFDLVDVTIVPPTYASQFVTDSGTAIPASHILNILGTAAQGISSSGTGNTVTLTIADSTTSQKGVVELATNAETITGSDTTRPVVPASLEAKLGALTANSIPYGAGTGSAISWSSALTDGQLMIGATGAAPAPANITSTGGTITITNGPNSINIDQVAGFAPISKYIVDKDGSADYTTIQSAINAAQAAGGPAAVYVRPSSTNYVENLTLYDGIDLWGAVGVADTQTCVIQGTHTPPTSGTFTCRNIFLQSATDIFYSTAAGSCGLILIDCATAVTNGYTFNLLNWTGGLTGFDIGEIGSTNDGWINNTGGSFVFMVNVTIGAGTANTMTVSGGLELYNAAVQCPIEFTTGTTGTANGGCWFKNPVTYSGNSQVDMQNSFIDGGSSSGINFNSSANVILSNMTIDSTATNAIAGTGAGTLTINNVSFPNSDGIASTLTLEEDNYTHTGEIVAYNIQRQIFTGFHSWSGSGNYYSISGTDFTLLRGGVGYIKGRKVEWSGSQSTGSLTKGSTYLIYIDEDGLIGATTTFSQANYEDNIPLFEILCDNDTPSNTLVVKENHPYSAPTDLSVYLHNSVGTVISNRNNGANITLNGTDEIEINGTDYLEDHGLETTIPDSGGVGETWEFFYLDGTGKWVLYSSTATFPSYYNNAGTPTALTAGKYGVFTLYCSKEDLNSSTPTYIAVMDDAQYNNQVQAETAIANEAVSVATNELFTLEVCQLGYVVYEQSSSSIVSVIIEKATIRGNVVSGTASTANLVTTDTTNFNAWLSAADTNVQSALDTLDDVGLGVTPQHSILLGDASYGITSTGVLTNGQLVIGSTGVAPAVASLTQPGAGLTITGGAGSITFALADDLSAVEALATTGVASRTGASTWSTSSITQDAVIIGAASEGLQNLTLTNGQLPIGSTGTTPVAASLTQPGAGLTITGGAGSITFALADDLSGLEGLATTGVASRTGASTWSTSSITQDAVILGAASEGLQNLALTNGQLVIGSTGATPVAASLTAPAAGITITGGAGSVTFALADDLSAVEGLGATGIVSRTAADTWTTTSITQHAVLIGDTGEVPANLGPLTNGQLVIGSTGVAPVAATLSNGNNITWTTGAGTLTGNLTGTTDHTVQVGNATGSLTSLAAATNGQLIIGSTGADPAVANLASADGSVTITNGAGTIDLAAATGLTWSVETGAAVAAAVNYGYITNRAGGITYTLPTTAAVGSIIKICSISGLATIAQNAGESIVFGLQTTTVGAGGSLVMTDDGDAIEIVCTVADTTWAVLSSVGNWTVN